MLQAHDFLLFEQDLGGKRNLSMACYFNVVCSGAVNRFHPVRGDMFIDRGARPSGSVRRSGIQVERNDSRTITLLRTELVVGFYAQVYKHLTPNGVKTAVEL